VHLLWNGEEIEVPGGLTVAAAGYAAGRLVLQRSRSLREPRGYFCGIGRCFSCAAVVDGVGRVLTCREPAREGMRVEVLDGDPEPPTSVAGSPATQSIPSQCDVLVIGGGPAGRSALQASRGRVVGITESASPGFHCGTVYGYFDGTWAVLVGDRSAQITAKKTILCTGSSEAGEPFPGWTRPGIMTATGARRLLAQGVKPGGRPLLHGVEPYLAWMASVLPAPTESTPIAAVEGRERVEAVTLADGRRVQTDAVILCTPPEPHLELAQLAGAELFWTGDHHVPVFNRTLDTTVPGVFVAGGVAGAVTARQAEMHGAIAAGASGDWEAVLVEARAAGVEPVEPMAWVASRPTPSQWQR